MNIGKLHRDGDEPALICGILQELFEQGKRQRHGDLPSVIDGTYQAWYWNDVLHRVAINRLLYMEIKKNGGLMVSVTEMEIYLLL